MIKRIIDFCIHERLVVILITVAAIAYGWYATRTVPLDAIPNVGENQVIVLTSWPGRSPKDVEDQITYPLSIALQAVPGSQSVRGKSMFGFSFVQVTFDDGIDFYWARSRVAEQLTTVGGTLPDGVTPTLGPDATALGQIYYYVLDPPPGMNLSELRTKQDFFIKYALQSVDGVAEVASIGGYVRQYQIEVDPDRLRYHGIPLSKVIQSVRDSNIDVGAKTVESGGMEFLVRGKGFVGADQDLNKAIEEIESTVVLSRDGIPVRIRDIAQVQVGPDFRRGALDLNGSEAVGGVVVMRYGENPRDVIKRVEEKIDSLESELAGIKIHGVYDRTVLINETVATLSTALWQEIMITVVVIVLFLLHVRTSLVVASTLPIAVLIAFVAMHVFGIDANIMSLAGIAIAIGTMVDMGIVVSENIYRHVAQWEAEQGSRSRQTLDDSGESQTLASSATSQTRLEVIREAAAEVAPAVMTAVTTTVVSFLPVFLLTGRDYRLFAPLAWTKTFALVASLIVAVLLVPLMCRLFLWTSKSSQRTGILSGCIFSVLLSTTCFFVWGHHIVDSLAFRIVATFISAGVGFAAGFWATREKVRPTEENPISRWINWAYEPTLNTFLRHKFKFLLLPLLIMVLGYGAWAGLPTVLYPIERVANLCGADLNEVPGYVDLKHSFTGLESDDWIALDEGSWFYMPTLYPAASFSQAMQTLQTQDALIKEIPEVANVLGKIGRVESALDPAPAAMVETYVMLKPRKEWRPGIKERDIWDQINALATLPGVTPASPLQPIEGRVVMLQSGIKAPMAVRIYGDSLDGLGGASLALAEQMKQHPYVNAGSVNPDIVMGKPYIEFDVDREEAARYGMTTMMVNRIVEAALGGVSATTTVEGRERYPIQIRYQRDLRERIDELNRLPIVTHAGVVVPLEQLAKVTTTWGPAAVNSEDARLVAHVAFSPSGIVGDLETVDAVMKSLQAARASNELKFPDGNFELQPVGSFENQIKTNGRLWWLGPLLDIDNPKTIENDEDVVARLLNWTPLGLFLLVIMINGFIIYLQFRELAITAAIFTAIPVAFGGGMIALGLAGTEMNTAIWVGFIALFGIAVDDGVVIGTYLNQIFKQRQPQSIAEIRAATLEAGLKRIRPCLMTTFTTLAALIPVLLSTGRGADVARAMALPVFGGMTVELVTLFVVPVVYCGYQEMKLLAGYPNLAGAQTIDDSGPSLPGPQTEGALA